MDGSSNRRIKAGDVFKFLWRNVDGKHVMRFQSEESVFKFLRHIVDEA